MRTIDTQFLRIIYTITLAIYSNIRIAALLSTRRRESAAATEKEILPPKISFYYFKLIKIAL